MSQSTKYIIFFCGIGLLIIECFAVDYSDFWAWRNFRGMSIPFLVIIFMFAVIMKSRSDKDNSNNQ